MKSILFISLLTLSQLSNALVAEPLDDLMSPDEIWSELQKQEVEFELNSAVPVETMGFFDFLIPRPAEPPQKEWNATLPEESFQLFGIDWLNAYEFLLVINKSNIGPTAQTATAYWQGQKFGVFKVSTGREKSEVSKSGRKYFSNTPTGWFHPAWLSKNHVSKTWEVPMPFSVFFNEGIATHAALPNYFDKLGNRASGGCVRLHPSHAEWIFDNVQKAGKGLVPEFTKTGQPVLDRNGNQKFSQNYRSLFIVVNRLD